jgi:hypothetical protein
MSAARRCCRSWSWMATLKSKAAARSENDTPTKACRLLAPSSRRLRRRQGGVTAGGATSMWGGAGRGGAGGQGGQQPREAHERGAGAVVEPGRWCSNQLRGYGRQPCVEQASRRAGCWVQAAGAGSQHKVAAGVSGLLHRNVRLARRHGRHAKQLPPAGSKGSFLTEVPRVQPAERGARASGPAAGRPRFAAAGLGVRALGRAAIGGPMWRMWLLGLPTVGQRLPPFQTQCQSAAAAHV